MAGFRVRVRALRAPLQYLISLSNRCGCGEIIMLGLCGFVDDLYQDALDNNVVCVCISLIYIYLFGPYAAAFVIRRIR